MNILKMLFVVVFVLSFSILFSQEEKNFTYDNLNRLTQVIYQGSPSNTVVNYTYNELGNRLHKSVSSFSLQLSVSAFLEGPFTGSEMNTGVNDQGIIPLSQPYGGSPWYYAGVENSSYIPADVVDWILVELRDATDAASAYGSTTVTRQAAFLLKDGKIVGLDGSSNLIFEETINQDLFVVIWHRNHLGVLSANSLTLTDGVFTYDFKTSAEQAYNSGQKDMGNYYGLYAGDADADGQINTNDNIVWKTEAGTNGYLSTDFNMDTQVDNRDKDDELISNDGKGSQVPE